MPIKPLNRNIVSEEIYKQMVGFIASGEWKPGEKIPSEAELKEKFSVSRISVREALQKLSALGLINSRPGLGTFVADVSAGLYMQNLIPVFLLDKPDIMQVLEFRKAVEMACAKLAARRADEDEIEELSAVLERIKTSQDRVTEYAEHDLEFHSLIFKMTKNQLFIKISLLMQEIFREGFMKQTAAAENFDYEQHEKIFIAIRDRDAEAAQQAMREHINNTMDRLKA